MNVRVFFNLVCCVLFGGKSPPGTNLLPPGAKANLIDWGFGWIFGFLSQYWFTYLLLLGMMVLAVRDMAARREGPWPYGVDWRLVGLAASGIVMSEIHWW